MKEIKERIVEENIGDYCTSVMKIFGANINIARSIPALIDSLKPVQRRILYTMYVTDAVKNFKKAASIIGSTMEMYHPHGDISIGDTLAGMAQTWNCLIPLVEPKGNFGSILGDDHGAFRYIGAKLSKYAYKCFFEEFDKDIVDMKKSYSGDYDEPEYLPSRYPHVLINSALGMGYGLATGIPSYNFREVIDLTLKLIDDSSYPHFTLIPDSPTNCLIVDGGQFEEISKTGRGKYVMRGVIAVDELKNCLVIKSVPYQVSVDNVKKEIIKLYDEKKIPGITSIKDHSDLLNGKINLSIYLKQEVHPQDIMGLLYKKTNLERTYSVQLKLIEGQKDYNFNIPDLLVEWISSRREQKRRIFNQKLSKLKNREHVLEILLFILNKDNAEKTLAIIKKSENKKEIVERLVKTYGITSLQADTIAEMRLHAFSKESYKRYKEEKVEVTDKINKLQKILRDPAKIDNIIKEELIEGREMFGVDRKSKIISLDGENLVRDTNHLMVFTKMGFVKKLPHNAETIGGLRTDDSPMEIFQANNRKSLLIFDETGKISTLPIHLIRNHEINSEGEKLSKFCTIRGAIISIITQPTEDTFKGLKQSPYLLFITKKGNIKKTGADKYINIKSELLGLIIKDKDELVQVKTLIGDRDMIIYTNNGYAVRFNSSEIKDTGRMTVGISAFSLEEDDYVIGMDFIDSTDKYIFVLTENGIGKKCTLDNFQTQERNSKLLKIINVEGCEHIFTKAIKGNEKFKVYTKNSITELDVTEVPELPRMSKGKKLIALGKGNYIIDIKVVK
jgi:DNA gyrase subunit A